MEEKRKLELIIKNNWDEFLRAYWLQDCPGCPEGHSSFWRTIILSPQWKLWQEEQDRRMKLLRKNELSEKITTFDMDEVEGLGVCSPQHFAEFINFTIKQCLKKTKKTD